MTAAQKAALLEQKRGELKTFVDAFRTADGGIDMKSDGLVQFRARNDELAKLAEEWEALQDAETKAAENDAKLAELKGVHRRFVPGASDGGAGNGIPSEIKVRPFRDILGESPEWKAGDVGARLKRAGGMMEVELGELNPAEAVSLMPQLKTVFQLSSAPQLAERLARIVPDEQEERSVVDLPAPGTVGADTFSYLEETTFTNAAAETTETNALGESALAMTERTGNVRWIGTWLPVTEQALGDVAFLESYIRGRLGFFVRQRLASQLLVGNGAAPNLRGFLNIAGIQTQAKGADPVFDAIFKAITLIAVNGFADADAVVLNPLDWQDIRLTRTADGLYILGNPADPAPERLFGLQVRQTTHETQNTGLVGAFRAHSQIFVRDGITLAATNSHEDRFVKGQVVIRASMRVGLAVYRPLAFCTVTGI